MTSSPAPSVPRFRRLALYTALALAIAFLMPLAVLADITMTSDPNGFYGFTWGDSLDELPEMHLTYSSDLIKEYELKSGPGRLGDAEVERVRFSTVEGKFARVAIRYGGENNHQLVMSYLQSRFGEIERMPGTMVRGLNQQYNWRGIETEITMTYRRNGERGYVYVESRTLAPRFLDALPEHNY